MAHVTAGHYAAGIVGAALLRRWYEDGDLNERRVAELRDIVSAADHPLVAFVLDPTERPLDQGYAEWSESYDGPNPLIDAEEPVVRPLLSRLAGPGVRALDAACGTGRHAAWLADAGCEVTGVDSSEAMLTVARAKVPAAGFERADVRDLPFDDGSFDLAVIALALCHVDDPTDGVVELARVLRPGGSLVITDPHPSAALVGGQAFYGGVRSGLTWVRNHRHGAATWLAAFRRSQLDVVDCVELELTESQITSSPAYSFLPEAVRGAAAGVAGLWIWHLMRP